MHTAFEGKVALVTGAAGGIGLATAKAFALAGASVVVADHNEKLVNEAAEKLRGEQRSRRDVRRFYVFRARAFTFSGRYT